MAEDDKEAYAGEGAGPVPLVMLVTDLEESL